MKSRRFGLNTLIGLCIVALLEVMHVSCVQVQEPEGGPMDTAPPQLINSYPRHKSKNFQDKKMWFTFDKEIEVEDIYNRLVFTPKLAPSQTPHYTYKVRGKTLYITLAHPLPPKTTYTLHFRNAVKDTREETHTDRLTLTFSTGKHLEPRYVTGQVQYLMTQQPAPNALVALYKIDSPQAANHILNTAPDYMTQTDAQGHFELAYVKPDTYRICAAESQESNLILNPTQGAPYGFLQEPVDLSETSAEDLNLSIVAADITPLILQNASPQGPYFDICFSKPITSYTLAPVDSHGQLQKNTVYSHLIQDGQVIRLYNTFETIPTDTLQVALSASDSAGHVIQETLAVSFTPGVANNEALEMRLDPVSETHVASDCEINMIFNKPIQQICPDSLFFVVQGKDKVFIHAEDLSYGPHQDTITLRKTFYPSFTHEDNATEQKASADPPDLVGYIPEGAFIAADGTASQTTYCTYRFKNSAACGKIQGSVTASTPGFIVQLLNAQYEVVDTVRNRSPYQFEEVLPGDYYVRVLGLRTPDAMWHFGNIDQLELPDPVVMYPHKLSVVPNWEINHIDLSF